MTDEKKDQILEVTVRMPELPRPILNISIYDPKTKTSRNDQYIYNHETGYFHSLKEDK